MDHVVAFARQLFENAAVDEFDDAAAIADGALFLERPGDRGATAAIKPSAPSQPMVAFSIAAPFSITVMHLREWLLHRVIETSSDGFGFKLSTRAQENCRVPDTSDKGRKKLKNDRHETAHGSKVHSLTNVG